MRWIVAVGLLWVSCATQTMRAYKPATMPHSRGADVAFSAVVEAVSEAGETISSKDREAGVVTTEWIEKTTAVILEDTVVARERLSIRATEDRIVVSIGCEQQTRSPSLGASAWEPCKDGERTELMTERSQRVWDLIKAKLPTAKGAAPEPTRESAADGTLGGPCYGNGTCNTDLTCDGAINRCTMRVGVDAATDAGAPADAGVDATGP